MKIVLIDSKNPKIINNEQYAVCLGVFDGVHKGHRKLIEATSKAAKEQGLKVGAVSFYTFNFKNKISTIEQNADIISSLGVDTLFLYHFNDDFKSMSEINFLKNELVDYINAKEIICGFNYTFGKNKKGTTQTLIDYQKEFGYNIHIVEPVKNGDEIISSTKIREYLKNGDLKKANNYLGREYLIEGVVQKGNMIGRTIDFPTANIAFSSELLMIKRGVYSSKTEIDNKIYDSITNIGVAPTFLKEKCISETFIIDYDKDIYNENIKVYLLDFLRDEMKFNSENELKETIKGDIKRRMKP